MGAKRVLILEISFNGHHPTYVRWLLESEFAKSSEIILAARREMFEHPEILAASSRFTRYTIDVSRALEARLSDFSSLGLIRMSYAIGGLYRRICAGFARTQPVDFVIVPFVDDCIAGLAIPREGFAGVPWLAITMRTMFHYSEMGVIAGPQRFAVFRRWLVERILKQNSMISLLTIDPTLAEFANRQNEEFMHKITYLPDPAFRHSDLPTKTEARSRLGVPPDVPLIVLFGEISARKGLASLLGAAADPACSPHLHVMLAGRCKDRTELLDNPAFRRLLAQGQLHTIEGYVTGAEERQLLAAADCMWLGYMDFYGMSGVMVLSGRHGVPVLGSREGMIGYLVEKHGLGVIIEPRDHTSVVGALNRLVHDRAGFEQFGKNGIRAFERHDVAEFQRIVTERVTTKMRADP